MSIAQSLLEQVRAFLPEAGVLRAVHLEVGALEHLEDMALQAAWAALTADDVLAGSKLAVTRVPIRVRCRACEADYHPEDPMVLACPSCGAVQPEVLTGTGVLLRRLDVDVPGEQD